MFEDDSSDAPGEIDRIRRRSNTAYDESVTVLNAQEVPTPTPPSTRDKSLYRSPFKENGAVTMQDAQSEEDFDKSVAEEEAPEEEEVEEEEPKKTAPSEKDVEMLKGGLLPPLSELEVDGNSPRKGEAAGERDEPVMEPSTSGSNSTRHTRSTRTSREGLGPLKSETEQEGSEMSDQSEEDEDEDEDDDDDVQAAPLEGCRRYSCRLVSPEPAYMSKYSYLYSDDEDEYDEYDQYNEDREADSDYHQYMTPSFAVPHRLRGWDPTYKAPSLCAYDSNPEYLHELYGDQECAPHCWNQLQLDSKDKLRQKEHDVEDMLMRPCFNKHRAYDPADYEHLPVSSEIKELFQFITRYTPQSIDLEFKLKPFIPEYIPAVGDIDAFIKIPRPDGEQDQVGLKMIDEPSAKQSDASVLDLQLRALAKQSTGKAVVVKKIDNVEKSGKVIEKWIKDISDLHRTKPPPTVHYGKAMPDIDNLMQEWPGEFEDLLKEVSLPSGDLDCDLTNYVDIICGILDIPIYKSRVQSLHVLFTLFSAFKNIQHFRNLTEEVNPDNDTTENSNIG